MDLGFFILAGTMALEIALFVINEEVVNQPPQPAPKGLSLKLPNY